MINYQGEYGAKLTTAEKAAGLIRSGMWLWYNSFNGKPIAFDKALAARKDELFDIKICDMLTLPPVPEPVANDPTGEHFTLVSMHFSGSDRKLHNTHDIYYCPIHYHQVPKLVDEYVKVDVGVFQVAPMSEQGYFNFGPQTSHSMAMITRLRREGKPVIVEINTNMPEILGGAEEAIHISQVSYIIEGDNPPLCELLPTPGDDRDRTIARYVMEEMGDGCCIQLGIGGVPNLVGEMIAESDLKDLGIHTEMLVDGIVDMYEKGRITGLHKAIDRYKIVHTFALGTKRLYDFLHRNPAVSAYPVDYTNEPSVIKLNPRAISINNAVMVDLFSQINGESDGFRHISGTGGMLDFAMGAFDSQGGKSIVALHATYTSKDGSEHSRIVPFMPPGSIVTIPRSISHYIVTEYGMACVKGRSTWERAEMVISLAHPDFRDDLIKEAEKMRIWRRTNQQDQ